MFLSLQRKKVQFSRESGLDFRSIEDYICPQSKTLFCDNRRQESPKDRVSDKGHTKVLTVSNVHEKRQKLSGADLKGHFALFLY